MVLQELEAGEEGELISSILHISDKLILYGSLVIANI